MRRKYRYYVAAAEKELLEVKFLLRFDGKGLPFHTSMADAEKRAQKLLKDKPDDEAYVYKLVTNGDALHTYGYGEHIFPVRLVRTVRHTERAVVKLTEKLMAART